MPTPQRLPIVNSDDGTWGAILNQFIEKEHLNTGTDVATNGNHKSVTINTTSTADDVITVNVGADTQKRIIVNGNGEIEWGSGALAVDTNLYRSTTNELKTDDTFISATDIKVGANSVYHAGNPPPASVDYSTNFILMGA